MGDPSPQCPYLLDRFVPICSAFRGGIRTPREAELERLCRTADHVRCPLFLEREAASGTAGSGTDTACRK